MLNLSRQKPFLVGLSPILRFVLRLSVPALLILSIAIPEHRLFMIERRPPSASVLQQLVTLPPQEILEEISEMSLAVTLGIPTALRTKAAQNVLSGRLDAPNFLSQPIFLNNWPNYLAQGSPTLQLALASLATEDLLLEAYERGGNPDFYRLARDRILAFAAWESQQRDPIAFLWNDHAVAARIPVIIRLWSHMRNDAQSTFDQKEVLVSLVERSGELLAKSQLFTVRTNHGVMQNVALLQIGAAFPFLSKVGNWRKIAVERLEMQLGYYVSDEGVVLEHSAEYHLFGTKLLAYAVRLCRLNGIEASQRLQKAYSGTIDFSRLLIRPDGTLPLIGNTASGKLARIALTSNGGAAKVVLRAPPFLLPTPGTYQFPLSGYSVWWSSDPMPSQAVVAWAKHENHGHKHSDEGSLNFWSRGYNWITGTGYWPYGASGFTDANGWSGSNSVHEKHEVANSERTVRLRGQGESAETRAIDIEVNRSSGFKSRRQIIQLNSEELLILDFINSANNKTETLWTTDSRLDMQLVDKKQFITLPDSDGNRLLVALDSSIKNQLQTSLFRGSLSPFAGWVVEERKPHPASTIRVSSPARNYVTATYFSVISSARRTYVKLMNASEEEVWDVSISGGDRTNRIKRNGQTICIEGKNSFNTRIYLSNPAPYSVRARTLKTAMGDGLKKYPPWRDLTFYHKRLYLSIFFIYLSIEAAITFLYMKRRKKSWQDYPVVIGWIGFSIWVKFMYLA